MENKMISRINTMGKVGNFICKVCKIVLIIAMVGCLVGGVLLCFVPRSAASLELTSVNTAVVHLDERYDISRLVDMGDIDGMLSMGGNSYKIVDDDFDDWQTSRTFYLSDAKWVLLAGILALAALYIPFHFGGKLCAAFRDCTTPFTQEISRGLTNLAWALIPAAVVSSLVETFSGCLFTGNWDISLDVNITGILMILCIFLLSYIFKYGTALQIQSDETL